MRLDRVSGVLTTGLRSLRECHHFPVCYVVAHSMGGLVSRTAITDAVKDEGSDFLLNIYATPLPKGTVHHLIYGAIEKGPFSLKGENDGVVTVVSETDLRVKESTTSFRHLLHEHTEILQKQETLDWVLELLKK
ncbi:hypothetical protein [Verrucomicrobium spinosum]|uniref:hypothetical protein n=1 Tax=Verrucomicrobium spinosum TaxID=2736 RepID=UPI000174500F|nr:hypothetical protein [Verrucomicrobium spinosum]